MSTLTRCYTDEELTTIERHLEELKAIDRRLMRSRVLSLVADMPQFAGVDLKVLPLDELRRMLHCRVTVTHCPTNGH